MIWNSHFTFFFILIYRYIILMTFYLLVMHAWRFAVSCSALSWFLYAKKIKSSSKLNWNENMQQYVDFNFKKTLTDWGWDKMTAIWQTTFFKFIFLCKNVCILIQISRKFIPKGPNNSKPTLVYLIDCCWTSHDWKWLPSLLKNICITQPPWGNSSKLCLIELCYLLMSVLLVASTFYYK